MLEYGETYLSENQRILNDMYAQMAPEAVELAKRMATDAVDDEEFEDA